MVTADPAEAVSRGECRECGAEILWARSENDNWTPLDLEPDATGTFSLDDGTAIYRPRTPRRSGAFYRFHGDSCPARNGN